MNFWNRLKLASKLISPTSKKSKTWPLLVSYFGGSSMPVWPKRDYKNFAEEAYMRNIIGFRCIDYVARSMAAVPWKLSRQLSDGEMEQIEDHWLLDLFKRPAPDSSLEYLRKTIMSFYLISGNAYVEKTKYVTDKNNPGRVAGLFVLRPDRMTITPSSKGRVGYYEYEVGGQKIRWDVDPITGMSDILHLKSFHPTDDWYGMSPIESAAREIDTYNEAVTTNKSLLENQGKPGLVVTVPFDLTDDQYDQLEEQLNAKYTGGVNSGRNMILQGSSPEGKPMEVTPYQLSPQELDFVNSKQDLARNICQAFGVPPMLLNIPGDNTYSNQREARQSFWEETILPQDEWLRGEMTVWLLNNDIDSELTIEAELGHLPAFGPRRDQMWERARSSADFLTVNERRELIGYETLDYGDVILVPGMLMPLNSVAEMGMAEEQIIGTEEQAAKKILAGQGYTQEEIDKMLGLEWDQAVGDE